MPSVTAIPGMIGRKVGMMTLYDGSGRARGVTVIELAGNRVTQIRNADRDGYEAVQIGAPGRRKQLTKPETGHLRAADLEREPLSELQEFHVTDIGAFELGQALSADQFEPGVYVNITGTSKGRGFAGVVRRWNFRGGPKTHGQSDRHRAPGSIGAGTTPGRVWKGQKMGGHMGVRQRTGMNQLVVYVDTGRQLLFVEGSVAGPRNGIVTIVLGRKKPRADYEPPVLDLPEIEELVLEEPDAPAEDASEVEAEPTAEAAAEDAPAAETSDETPAAESEAEDAPTDDAAAETASAEDAADEPSDDETKDEAGA
jgi:large subunit ribosomal protein L3